MAVAEPTMPTPAMMAGGGEDLDGATARQLNEIKEALNKKPSIPPWLIPLMMWMVLQLVGSIWWAATKDSDIRYLQNENLKLWQKVETHDLMLGRMEKMIRDAVKEEMADANYVRVGKKGDD